MASTSRRIIVRFDGTTTGLNRAAGQAANAIDKFHRRSQLAVGALTAAGAAAPALLAGATLLFAGLAAAGLASSDKVRIAFSSMGREVRTGLQQDAQVLEATAVTVAARLGAAFQRVRPILQNVFAAIGPQILTLTDGLTGLVENMLPGLARAALAAGNAVNGLADFLRKTGTGVSDFFDQIATSGPNAGKVWSELGTLMGNVLPVLGKLLAVASDFASGALPVFNAALKGLLDILASVLDFLKPIAPVLGGLAAAVVATAGAFKIFALLRTLVMTFGAATMLAGLQVGTFISRLGLGAVAGARFATALTTALRMIPIALIAVTAGTAGAATGIRNSTEAMQAGGQAARDYAASVDGFGNKLLTNLKGFALTLISFGASGGPAEGLATVNARVNELRASMTPLQRAQDDVARSTNDYNLAVKDFGASSPQAIAALDQMKSAVDREAAAQDAAKIATKGHLQALHELSDFMAGELDANLAYEQSVLRTKQAQDALAEATRSGKLSQDELKASTYDLVGAALSQANAARAQAEAANQYAGEAAATKAGDAAWAAEIGKLAGTLKGPAKAAIIDHINGLSDAGRKAAIAALETNGFNVKLKQTPDGKQVVLSVEAGAANAAIDNAARTRTARINVVWNSGAVPGFGGLQVGGRSAGGPIRGPGTGTSDTAGLFALSKGEHVWTAAEVRRAGGHRAMAAMREQFRGLATGGPVGAGGLGAGPEWTSTPPPEVRAGDVNVTVMIDGQEFRGMIRSEISEDNRNTRRRVTAGAGRGV